MFYDVYLNLNNGSAYLKDSSIGEHLLTISLPSVEVELANELLARGPAIQSISMLVVFVERALIVLHQRKQPTRVFVSKLHLAWL